MYCNIVHSGDTDFPLKFSPKLLPKALKDRRQWICWRWEWNDKKGRWDKPPVSPHDTSRRASTKNSTTWSSFRHALEVHKANASIDGIGYVLTDDDSIAGADFDGCITEDGELDQWVADWLQKLGGYVEVSPSGTGVHCIVKAVLPGTGKNTRLEGRDVEVYDRGRFLTTTGAMFVGYETPAEAQEAVDELYQQLQPPQEAEQEIKRLRSTPLADDQLLDKARAAASGWKFRRLYDKGDWQGLGYKSQSNADMALVNMLIFWAGGDREQITELFEASALYRSPRIKRGGYVQRTVDGALGSYRGSYYDPGHAKHDGVREKLQPYFDLIDHSPAWRGGKKPAARKVLTAIVLAAAEHGTIQKRGIQIGLDMRTIMEEAHVSSRTLLQSSLPLLVQEDIVKWVRKGRGRGASVFLLPLPLCEQLCEGKTVVNHTSNTVLPPHTSRTLGDEERRELLRASQGRTPSAPIPRVANAKQVLLEHLVGTVGNRLTVEELAERTGRRRPDVRRDMGWLLGVNLVAEAGDDAYQLSRDFWRVWREVLSDSGVIRSENKKRNRHENERLVDAGFEPVWGETGEEWVDSSGEVFSKEDALAATSPGHEPG